MSCYLPRFLHVASWNDAQTFCNNNNSSLWTIGSHEEWNYIFAKTSTNLNRYYSRDDSDSDGIFDPLLSTHFFIGLIQPDPEQLDARQVSAYIIHRKFKWLIEKGISSQMYLHNFYIQ